jgi:hypothetical protein
MLLLRLTTAVFLKKQDGAKRLLKGPWVKDLRIRNGDAVTLASVLPSISEGEGW